MTPHLYLNLIPESLVASALGPSEYGSYMAVGMYAKTRGQAAFFEVNAELAAEAFAVGRAFDRCRRESVSAPKHSVYLSIYRVLERLPVEALGGLHLVTDDGRVLALERGEYRPEEGRAFHLYQEFVPVKPRVVSRLGPPAFCRHVTRPGEAVSLPRVVFAELMLEGLSTDPAGAMPQNLPYPNIDHLRDCILGLIDEPDKQTKVVIRHLHQELLYRTIRNGFFVGDQAAFAYYPMPSHEELEKNHREWLRSAETLHIE